MSLFNFTNCTLADCSSAESFEVEWHTLFLLSVAYGTISVLSVAGNTLIIWAVVANKRMHNVTNYFLCNVAVADTVIGVFSTPFQVIFRCDINEFAIDTNGLFFLILLKVRDRKKTASSRKLSYEKTSFNRNFGSPLLLTLLKSIFALSYVIF